MEPIITTLGVAALAQIQPVTLIASVIAGYVGNRSDTFICKYSKKIYERITQQVSEPHNHDIQKAVRKAYLKATLLAVKHVKSDYKWYQSFTSDRPSDLKDIISHLVEELKLINKDIVKFPETSFHEQFNALLFPKNVTTEERLPEMIGLLKNTVLEELNADGRRVEDAIKGAIENGWQEGDKKIDWFELICAFFNEELKINSRLSTFIQSKYLNDINEGIEGVNICMEQIDAKLNTFYEDYKSIFPQVEEILLILSGIEETLKKLPELTRQILSDELDSRRVVLAQLPNLSVSARHNELTDRLEKSIIEEQEKRLIIEDTKAELQEAADDAKERKQRMFDRAEAELIKTLSNKDQVEVELKQFVADVLKLAEQFEKEVGTANPMREKARKLFYEGRFEEVDELLSEEQIYADMERHHEKAIELSELFSLKARATAINKAVNWFEQAKKFYIEAARISENAFSCIEFAAFLDDHRQFRDSIPWYQKSLKYLTDDNEKAMILNALSAVYREIQDFGLAKQYCAQALDIRKNLAKINSKSHLYYVAETLNIIGIIQKHENDYKSAEISFIEAVEILRDHEIGDESLALSTLANTLNNLGVLRMEKGALSESEVSFNEALQIHNIITLDGSEKTLADKASTFNNLGILKDRENDFKNAEKFYSESLRIRRELAHSNPQRHMIHVATSLNNLSILWRRTSDLKKSEDSIIEAIHIHRILVESDAQIYSQDLATSLCNLGVLQVQKQEFENAEASYNESLEIRTRLASENLEVYSNDLAATLNNLGVLHSQLRNFEKAKNYYQKELEIYRALALSSYETYISHVARTLNNLGIVLTNSKDFSGAKVALDEALEIRRSLIKSESSSSFFDLAMTLICLGHVSLAKGEYRKVEELYTEGFQILERLLSFDVREFNIQYASTCIRLALIHKNNRKDKKKSVFYANETIRIFSVLTPQEEYAEKSLDLANEILQYWKA